MASTISLESPLAPDRLLESLATFGKDWRESKLPASVRSEGFYDCQIRVVGPRFELRLAPQGEGPQIVWRGVVRSNGTSAGSQIEVNPAQTPGTVWSYAIVLALILFAWVAPQFREGRVAFPLIGLAVMTGFIMAAVSRRRSSQAEVCREILESVVATPRPDRDPAT